MGISQRHDPKRAFGLMHPGSCRNPRTARWPAAVGWAVYRSPLLWLVAVVLARGMILVASISVGAATVLGSPRHACALLSGFDNRCFAGFGRLIMGHYRG